jgi:tripartite-type tricarboxylate transporter receptor subunit TctC
VSANKIDPHDYEPVFMYGETCWALIANVGDQSIGIDSLAAFKGKELIVGTPAIGNAMHLTGIMIADKYQFKVKPVLFKSQYDALIEMTANDTVNLVLNEVHNFETMKQRNPKLQMLGMSCPTRFKGAPNIKTLKEQGINSPRIYTASLASSKMPVETRKEIEKIFEQAVVSIGEDALAKDTIVSPTLMGQSSTAKFKEVNEYLMKLQTKYKKEINDN